MKRIVVTGASGFIGSALVRTLARGGAHVRGAYRSAPGGFEPGVDRFVVGEMGPTTDWAAALEGADAVVHLAGPAQTDKAADWEILAAGAARLAHEAAAAGAGRIVVLSSARAVATRSEAPLGESRPPRPHGDYGRGKLAVEQAVLGQSGVSTVVLRPPLVHGPGAKGNFARLLRLADTWLPLPFEGLQTRRSLIALAHLITAIEAVISSPAGPSGVFHVTDQPSLTPAELVTALRQGLGRRPALWFGGAIRPLMPHPFRESLELDDSRFRAAYGAYCAVNSREALAATAKAWKQRR